MAFYLSETFDIIIQNYIFHCKILETCIISTLYIHKGKRWGEEERRAGEGRGEQRLM